MRMICAIYAQMSDLATMKLFAAVVESGSFSAAARLLDVKPSSVSRQISNLEECLGAGLFQRTTRNQHLTEAGEIYYQHIQRIIADIETANSAVQMHSNTASGSLFLTVEVDLATILIEPLLPEFLRQHPQIQIRLDFSPDIEALVQGGFDIAVRIGHLNDSSLIAKTVATSRSIICASPDYLKQRGTPTHPEDLRSHSCLSFNTKARKIIWTFDVDGETLDVPVSGPIAANGLVFLRQAAMRGLGIVMIPSWAINDAIKDKQLVAILEDYPSPPASTPISVVFAQNRNLAPKVRAFVDFLAKHLDKQIS